MMKDFSVHNGTLILLDATNKSSDIASITAIVGKHLIKYLANSTFKTNVATEGEGEKQLEACSRDKSYVAIIISVLPIWAMLTTLFLLALLQFGKHTRLTKIYDNCNRLNATNVYHIEIRTGDTSASYVKRKTSITIDMFDENQNTLARIAIPGHVIFGRKEDPVNIMDDDKFFELRITRLWLYRISKLKKVTTIRLTHTCTEPEARVMVYGVELRVDDADKPKLFFPVMNYITAYGAANKINTCFDLDNTGTISAMGGRTEPSLANETLIAIDYSILIYLFVDLVFFMSTFRVYRNWEVQTSRAILKGAIIGALSFAVAYFLGLYMRYVVKRQYALNVATGIWFYTYHLTNCLYVLVATAIWIYSTIYAYNTLCTNHHTMWLIGLCIAAIVGFLCATIVYLIYYMICNHRFPHHDHFTMPDDGFQTQDDQAGNSVSNKAETGSKGRARQQDSAAQAAAAAAAAASPSILMMPNMGGPSNITGLQPWQPQTVAPGSPQPIQMMVPHAGFAPYPVHHAQQQTSYKGYHQPFGSPQQQNQSTTIGQLRPMPIIQHHPATPQGQSYHQQMAGAGTGGGITSGRAKTKRTGSQESTGSTYYQQLMKNKGGVKSISQYGELMKQKKNKKQT